MFDAIARRYDALNRLLSVGFDRRWRRRAVRALELAPDDRVLDVCTGTADLAIEALSAPTAQVARVLGVDFSHEMLRIARRKGGTRNLSERLHLVRGDATRLPVPDQAFGAAMVAFGIRNVVDPEQGCRELWRALVPGGRLAILEFGSPRVPGLRAAYLWYFRRVLPCIGRLVSRHSDAYAYLPASVAEFPSGDEFARLLGAAGFAEVRYERLTFGIVYLYLGRRPSEGEHPRSPAAARAAVDTS